LNTTPHHITNENPVRTLSISPSMVHALTSCSAAKIVDAAAVCCQSSPTLFPAHHAPLQTGFRSPAHNPPLSTTFIPSSHVLSNTLPPCCHTLQSGPNLHRTSGPNLHRTLVPICTELAPRFQQPIMLPPPLSTTFIPSSHVLSNTLPPCCHTLQSGPNLHRTSGPNLHRTLVPICTELAPRFHSPSCSLKHSSTIRTKTPCVVHAFTSCSAAKNVDAGAVCCKSSAATTIPFPCCCVARATVLAPAAGPAFCARNPHA